MYPLYFYDGHVHGLINVDMKIIRHLLCNRHETTPEQVLVMPSALYPETGMELVNLLLQRENWTDLSVRYSE